jgi:hypothetical protein
VAAELAEGAEPFDMVFVPAEEEVCIEWEASDYCEVCRRCTNHFAEHDDLLEMGYAYYDVDGVARWTDAGRNWLYNESYGR